jgi:signal transduction histidine kinase
MTAEGSAEERLRKLRHDLANPLSAVLAEAQLLLMRKPPLDQETVEAVREIESLCRRMGERLQQS